MATSERKGFDRRNATGMGRWWWTVDRATLFALMALVFLGVFMVVAASPAVATRIGLNDFYFVTRHELFLVIAVAVMIFFSALSVQQIRRFAAIGFAVSLVLMFLLPLIGYENKGAVRWIHFMGFSLQPSEFLKPCFAVFSAWIFAERFRNPEFPSYRIAFALYALVVMLLIIQPDFGMVVTVTGMFGVQFFLAGMPFIWVIGLMLMGIGGSIAAYQFMPHVTSRIDRFLNPAVGDNYQVAKSIEAFQSGGWIGRGPGEGVVKLHIPDSHTDFIFAVAGEEFGVIFCLLVIGIFAFIVIRGYVRLWTESNMFTLIAVSGLIAQFGIQAIVNMGVAVNLLPAKGMTLPFLSYGGSSLVAMAFGMGMMLALTRKRYGQFTIDLRR
jgi:cell division protein FtsW